MHGLVFEGLLFFCIGDRMDESFFLQPTCLHKPSILFANCFNSACIITWSMARASPLQCMMPLINSSRVTSPSPSSRRWNKAALSCKMVFLNGCNFLSTHSLCSQHSHWWLSKWPNHYLSKKNSVHSKAGWISSCMLQPTCSGDSGQSLVCSKWDLLGSFKEASNTHECNFMRES